jgi:hypothetical protein
MEAIILKTYSYMKQQSTQPNQPKSFLSRSLEAVSQIKKDITGETRKGLESQINVLNDYLRVGKDDGHVSEAEEARYNLKIENMQSQIDSNKLDGINALKAMADKGASIFARAKAFDTKKLLNRAKGVGLSMLATAGIFFTPSVANTAVNSGPANVDQTTKIVLAPGEVPIVINSIDDANKLNGKYKPGTVIQIKDANGNPRNIRIVGDGSGRKVNMGRSYKFAQIALEKEQASSRDGSVSILRTPTDIFSNSNAPTNSIFTPNNEGSLAPNPIAPTIDKPETPSTPNVSSTPKTPTPPVQEVRPEVKIPLQTKPDKPVEFQVAKPSTPKNDISTDPFRIDPPKKPVNLIDQLLNIPTPNQAPVPTFPDIDSNKPASNDSLIGVTAKPNVPKPPVNPEIEKLAVGSSTAPNLNNILPPRNSEIDRIAIADRINSTIPRNSQPQTGDMIDTLQAGVFKLPDGRTDLRAEFRITRNFGGAPEASLDSMKKKNDLIRRQNDQIVNQKIEPVAQPVDSTTTPSSNPFLDPEIEKLAGINTQISPSKPILNQQPVSRTNQQNGQSETELNPLLDPDIAKLAGVNGQVPKIRQVENKQPKIIQPTGQLTIPLQKTEQDGSSVQDPITNEFKSKKKKQKLGVWNPKAEVKPVSINKVKPQTPILKSRPVLPERKVVNPKVESKSKKDLPKPILKHSISNDMKLNQLKTKPTSIKIEAPILKKPVVQSEKIPAPLGEIIQKTDLNDIINKK